jgi:hypothetical protein
MSVRAWAALIATAVVLVGCETASHPPGAADDNTGRTAAACIDKDGDGYGLNCALGDDCDDGNPAITNGCYVCAHDAPGCPCTKEQARTSCGKVSARLGNTTTCAYGESVCTNGKWGECIPDGKTVKSFDTSRRTNGLSPAVACVGNVCDPYCQQYPDTPDDTLSTPTGIVGTPGGLTLEALDAGSPPPLMPNGPMPDYVKDRLTDAGLVPDANPDVIIYHELPPPATAQDQINTKVTGSKPIDVYFLENNAGRMQPIETRVKNEVPAAGGTVDQILAVQPDTRFGVGRFAQYDQANWNDTGITGAPMLPDDQTVMPYEHILSPQTDRSELTDALQWALNQCIWAPTTTRSWMPALYAIATGGGLPGTPSPWVAPRNAMWSSRGSLISEGGACPAGTVGYPCFRPGATPITVLLTDTPSNNGPGGQFAYARNAAWGIAGAQLWSAAPVPVVGNGTEATAQVIDITKFATFSGNTTAQGTRFADGVGYPAAGMGWEGTPAGPYIDCEVDRGTTAKNVFFTFTVTKRTAFHFDAIGSNFRVVPYVYGHPNDPMTGMPITTTFNWLSCNEWGYNDPANPQFGDPDFVPTSVDGVVDPGSTYYLVIDGKEGSEGDYVLHVNAMPDGAASGQVTEPNYDESLAAYNAIGGKVVAVDGSGYTCGSTVYKFLQKYTGDSLKMLLTDTGSLNAGGNPAIIYLQNNGSECNAADAPFPQQLATAILDISGNNSRANITAVAIDVDDAIDFDGPPGGPVNLTPVNIDDATFVDSIVTAPTAQTMANCTQTLADHYVGCLPGTQVAFTVNFSTPAAVPVMKNEQIFGFVIRILADGTRVLAEIPVIIVVPAVIPPVHHDAWFVRDYDTTGVCPMGTAPVWGLFAWNADTPSDSQIDFKISVAPTFATLTGNPSDFLRFSQPPGPTPLVGMPIGVHRSISGGPDTQAGAALIDSTLDSNMWARDSKALRLQAHLIPSSDLTQTPTLQAWNLQISCQPAE